MAETGGKKKKKGTAVPLGEFLAADNKKADWADVSDEDGDRGDDRDRYEDRRGDSERYGDRRGGGNYRSDRYGDRGDRYGGGGDRYGGDRDRGNRYGGDRDRGDRYGGGDRGGDRYGGGDRERGGDRYDDRGGRRGGDRRRNDGPPKEPPNQPPYIAFVGNLDFSADESAVIDFFSEHCKVTTARLLIDRQTGRSRGYGYVTFEDRESLVTALEANGVDFQGRPLRVDVAEERADTGSNTREGGRPPREVAPSRADQVDKWERGKTIPVQEKPERRQYSSNRGDRGDRGGGNRGERKPLNLQPRSDNAGRDSDRPSSSKPNPFGDAKPRDELYYQQKKEEEWASRGGKKSDEKGQKSQNRGGKPRQAKEESKPVETTNLYAVLEKEEGN